jgi:hypothetical protein
MDGDTSMTMARLRRAAAGLSALVVTAALTVTATPQPAAADGTRTITGTTSCFTGIVPFGFSVNYGSGWTYADSSYQIPGTQIKVWTKVIPSTATSIALDTFCYYSWSEYNGTASWPYGTWIGYTYSLTPGTSTVNSRWYCNRYPVNPGPFVRTGSLDTISYS